MKTYAVVIGAETEEIERLRLLLSAPELSAAALMELAPPRSPLSLVPPFRVQGDGRVLGVHRAPDQAALLREVPVSWVVEVLEVRGGWWRVSNHPLWMRALDVRA